MFLVTVTVADDALAGNDAAPSAVSTAPAPTTLARGARRPRTRTAANAPVASGLQALLARRAASARTDREE
ncbi:hypothetical protein OHA79_50115 (plasmid) [Streptomyces sp. NBC_00841]|uniref:hypothetical protein n=1 Tax=Streptomyces sp. NBC_00841 TaxID=2975847 RepID=UPI002DD7B355|nr:hypothetical protein [Streptomyces sp. NBC_00841]WSA05615.1 hypothetical protein OHA79_50115 [Streptomyces sp. NBC_00841]